MYAIANYSKMLKEKRQIQNSSAVNVEKKTSYSVRSILIITVLCGNKSTFIYFYYYWVLHQEASAVYRQQM
jgi:hypothetical protein